MNTCIIYLRTDAATESSSIHVWLEGQKLGAGPLEDNTSPVNSATGTGNSSAVQTKGLGIGAGTAEDPICL